MNISIDIHMLSRGNNSEALKRKPVFLLASQPDRHITLLHPICNAPRRSTTLPLQSTTLPTRSASLKITEAFWASRFVVYFKSVMPHSLTR